MGANAGPGGAVLGGFAFAHTATLLIALHITYTHHGQQHVGRAKERVRMQVQVGRSGGASHCTRIFF